MRGDGGTDGTYGRDRSGHIWDAFWEKAVSTGSTDRLEVGAGGGQVKQREIKEGAKWFFSDCVH